MSGEASDKKKGATKRGAADKGAADKGAAAEKSPSASAPNKEVATPRSREEPLTQGPSGVDTPFREGNHETVMTYGHGGFPKYVMAVWVIFLIGYAVYFYWYGLPDLSAWGSP